MVEDLSKLLRDGRIIGKANFLFTPEIASSLGSIHGSLFNTNESLVMGRDYHNDCRMLKIAYSAGVLSTGVKLLDLSVCTFPLLQFTIRRFGASGGIYFSGGHLYSSDVGIRFVDSGGIEFSQAEINKIIEAYNTYPKSVRRMAPTDISDITDIPQTEDIYMKSLIQFVNKERIKNANFKIVVDCSYGPTGRTTPILINDLGVEIIALNTHYKKRSYQAIPSIRTLRNTANIVKASNSHMGVCFDVDGSRILVLDENGLEIEFDDLIMLFVSYDDKIQKSKSSTIILSTSVSPIVKDFIEEKGFIVKQVNNSPGEISRQIREERACFGAAITLKYYFTQFSPFSDGNFILLKLLDIMSKENDLISSLIQGFPKGKKVNKSINITLDSIEDIHNKLIEKVNEVGLKYQDIINELQIIENNVTCTIKVALNRDAILLSAESDDEEQALKMIKTIKQLIVEK
ncbi:MAG: hypothetical protein ACTSXH_09725 [Promethearchaeota archaeon]